MLLMLNMLTINSAFSKPSKLHVVFVKITSVVIKVTRLQGGRRLFVGQPLSTVGIAEWWLANF